MQLLADADSTTVPLPRTCSNSDTLICGDGRACFGSFIYLYILV